MNIGVIYGPPVSKNLYRRSMVSHETVKVLLKYSQGDLRNCESVPQYFYNIYIYDMYIPA